MIISYELAIGVSDSQTNSVSKTLNPKTERVGETIQLYDLYFKALTYYREINYLRETIEYKNNMIKISVDTTGKSIKLDHVAKRINTKQCLRVSARQLD